MKLKLIKLFCLFIRTAFAANWIDLALMRKRLGQKWQNHDFGDKTVLKNLFSLDFSWHVDRVKRIWYLSPMRAAKVQASLRIRAVSPEPSLLAYTSSESRGTFRQKARSLAPLNGWACAVKICHDGIAWRGPCDCWMHQTNNSIKKKKKKFELFGKSFLCQFENLQFFEN